MQLTSLPLAFFLATFSFAAAADDFPIVFTIDNLPVSGTANAIVTFDATMTNVSANTQFLNSDSVSFSMPVDDSAFIVNWPLSLAAGATYGSSALFNVTIPADATPGAYSGVFDVLGGTGDGSYIVGSAEFTLDVQGTPSAVPEPATWAMMLLGLAGIGFTRRRASRKNAAVAA